MDVSCPLIIDIPPLLSEWDYEHNQQAGLFPDKLSGGSNKHAQWVCKKNHHWKAAIYSRYKGRHGCPYCSGRIPILGENDLATVSPALSSEWNYEKNVCLLPQMVTANSSKKVWWKCSNGHEWIAKISHRQDGSGCPFCSGREAISGETDLATLYPSIAFEWDYEKNGDLSPDTVKPMSAKKVWWICSNNHHYDMRIQERVKGNNCPYCANRRLLPGYNDLATLYPNLISEWDYKYNKQDPTKVLGGGSKQYQWKCKRGHFYLSSVNSRKRGRGCPYCANLKVLSGFNDLASVFPDIANEWNYEKNGIVTPKKIVYGSSKRVWWKCDKGHEWEIPVINRTRDGNGCPICNKAKSTSFPERALLYYVRNAFPSAIGNYRDKTIRNREIDVFLSQFKIGIEYDGDIWHRDSFRDNEKNQFCNEAGITLIRIREPECPPLDGNSIDYIMADHSHDEYNRGIAFVLGKIAELTGAPLSIDVSIDRDFSTIICAADLEEVNNSLAVVNPALAKEWHPTKNGGLLPSQFAANSGRKVWWLGPCGHEWQATIASRNSGKCGCSICQGLTVLQGYNDLESLFPDIAKEWNYQKNKDSPSDYVAKSGKKVWWTCPKGHDYQAKIAERTGKNRGCPYCSNHRVLVGYNDLQTTHPALSEEWNYEKNRENHIDIAPNQITAGKGIKVWWRCKKCGYEWPAYVGNRSRGAGCPRCSNRIRKLKQED